MLLHGYRAGQTKREYIEAVIDDCKEIFHAPFASGFFHNTNLKVAFCTSEDQESVYQAFCEQHFPLYLAEGYSGANYFAAQAMTNTTTGIYGILICLDTEDEGDIWYQIILHEMSHIFCIVNEIGGENFQDKYSKKNMGDTSEHISLSTGYTIWREFIADHIAFRINPFSQPISLANLRNIIHQLDEEITPNEPNRAAYCALMLFYIFTHPKISAASDADGVFQVLDKNRILPSGGTRKHYKEMIRLIFWQLHRDPCWRIRTDFIEELGEAYIGLMFFKIREIQGLN